MSPNVGTVDGHPLGLVARRLHDPSRCVCCGSGAFLWRVNVEAVADGRLTTIDLCEHCVCSDDGAWRLRWQPVPYERCLRESVDGQPWPYRRRSANVDDDAATP